MAKVNEETKIGSAHLEFGPNGTPKSSRFNDTYFDVENGLAESRHVFIEGASLEASWADQDTFTIGETGFGTGLNFLITWQAWRDCVHKPKRLNYVSVEGFPLTQAELEICLEQHSELAPLAEALIAAYRSPQPGYHRLYFDDDAVSLTLLFGPVLSILKSLDAKVDAWFLDGFAPDRNPDMWHPDLFAELARLSGSTTRLATFTVAGQVRRDLKAVGFELEKRVGFGSKRENLAGWFPGSQPDASREPWFRLPNPLPPDRKTVAIIGNGLAGASAAYAFKRRGFSVTVIDRHAAIASEASAAPSAIFMPRLTAGYSTDGAFYAAAWQTLLSLLCEIQEHGQDIDLNQCGAIRLARSPKEKKRQDAILESGILSKDLAQGVTSDEANEIAGIDVDHSGLYFSGGGTLSPRLLCKALLHGIDKRVTGNVQRLTRVNDHWVASDGDRKELARADCVVLASGLESARFEQTSWLPLTARLGQLSTITSNDQSRMLGCVLADEGHVTPARNETHVIGATFDHIREQDKVGRIPIPDREADERNLHAANALTQGLFKGSQTLINRSWAGIRCTTRDHLPLAGPVPIHASFINDFSELRHGHRWSQYPQSAYHDGLYVLTGLGAHGVVSAPLAAELIASMVHGDPLPLPRSIAQALHPGRFLVRDLKRGKA